MRSTTVCWKADLGGGGGGDRGHAAGKHAPQYHVVHLQRGVMSAEVVGH